MCNVSSCTTLTVCHRPLLRSWCVYIYLSPVECDPASQFMCADQAKCVDVRFCCEGTHLCRGLRGENGNITSKTASCQ